jgi:phosphatidylglycerol:prolipoprotein diacylglycerol transferase
VPAVSPYTFLLLAGIALSLSVWVRLARRDPRLLAIYAAALAGAFLGAKIAFLAAEGWIYWDSPYRWQLWAAGKTVLGALLGGYGGVELMKATLGYRQATGDLFALVAPFAIFVGRIGCLLHGCCLGVVCPAAWWTMPDSHGRPRWPAVPLEMAFNLLFLALVLALRRKCILPGQHFHLYLIAYGLFRFGHEWLRDTPRVAQALSGYHILALLVVSLGVAGFLRRQRAMQPATVTP